MDSDEVVKEIDELHQLVANEEEKIKRYKIEVLIKNKQEEGKILFY